MDIIFEDKKTGKAFKAVGKDIQWEILRKSSETTKHGNKPKREWQPMNLFPTTLENAVYHCVRLLLCQSDDPDEIVIEAENMEKQTRKMIKKRIDDIVASLKEEK